MGVSSLPKNVTRQRRGCDLNRPTAPESSTLTTRLPSHQIYHYDTVIGQSTPNDIKNNITNSFINENLYSS